MPKWRNWQTRCVQGAVGVRPCGFKSHLRHLQRQSEVVSTTSLYFASRPATCRLSSLAASSPLAQLVQHDGHDDDQPLHSLKPVGGYSHQHQAVAQHLHNRRTDEHSQDGALSS